MIDRIIFKPGVLIPYLTLPMAKAFVVLMEMWSLEKNGPVITSMIDGKHMRGSLHYDGKAFDLRTFYFKGGSEGKVVKTFARELSKALGKDYDVVVEKDHIHCEFDPKTTKKKV